VHTRASNSEKMNGLHSDNRKSSDSWLNSSRAKLLVAQPDRFYLEFVYNVLHNHMYHMDTDCVLINMKTLEPVAVMEWIKGLDQPITDFKMTVYTKMARRLNIDFFIVNWDESRGIQVTDVFRGTTRFQTWQEHTIWLRDLKYAYATTNPVPHSECCDCYQCIPTPQRRVRA